MATLRSHLKHISTCDGNQEPEQMYTLLNINRLKPGPVPLCQHFQLLQSCVKAQSPLFPISEMWDLLIFLFHYISKSVCFLARCGSGGCLYSRWEQAAILAPHREPDGVNTAAINQSLEPCSDTIPDPSLSPSCSLFLSGTFKDTGIFKIMQLLYRIFLQRQGKSLAKISIWQTFCDLVQRTADVNGDCSNTWFQNQANHLRNNEDLSQCNQNH